MIQLKNIGLKLSQTPILNDISLDIPTGAYCSLIGPNGAGKSSLIKCLCGIHTHYTGEIQISHKNLAAHSAKQRARAISYVPQNTEPLPDFSVEEMVMMGRYPHQTAFAGITQADRIVVEQALAETELSALAPRNINTLSGGERQRAYLAAALAQGAPTLVLDEPSAFLDYAHQAHLFALLKKLNEQQHKTIIIVSHDLNHALRNSTQIIALKNGALVFSAAPEKLLAPDTLPALFDTPFEIIKTDRGHHIIPEEKTL